MIYYIYGYMYIYCDCSDLLLSSPCCATFWRLVWLPPVDLLVFALHLHRLSTLNQAQHWKKPANPPGLNGLRWCLALTDCYHTMDCPKNLRSDSCRLLGYLFSWWSRSEHKWKDMESWVAAWQRACNRGPHFGMHKTTRGPDTLEDNEPSKNHQFADLDFEGRARRVKRAEPEGGVLILKTHQQ